jgi:ribosomal protein L29
MKFSELQVKGSDELQGMLKELQAKLLQMRFDLAEKRLKDVSQIKKTKITIAQILTALKTQSQK